MGVDTLATDPVNPDNLYVLGGSYTQSWAGNVALFRSGDRGVTFSRVDLPFKAGGNEDGRSMGERLQVDPHDNRILYLGTRNDGLWRSEDAGLTWARLGSFPVTGDAGLGVSFVEVDAATGVVGAPSPVVYAGVADKAGSIYRSTDAGATWARVPGQPTGWYAHHGRLGADGLLYVTYGDRASDMHDGGVWAFNPGTGTWRDIAPLRPNTGVEGGFGYAGLAVDAQHPGTVMVATLDRWTPGDDIFRSTDGGTTWRSITDRRGDVWIAAGQGGQWRSTDGGLRYTQVTSGVSAADAVAFGKAAPGARSMAVYLNGVVDGQRGVFRSDDAAATWVRVNDDKHQWGWTGSCLGADPRVYGRVFVCTNGRGIQVGELAPR